MTTTPQTLLDLAARVEGLAQSERDIDAEIACIIGKPLGNIDHWLHGDDIGYKPTAYGYYVPILPDGSIGTAFASKEYTASLDAAMTLVPEGGRWFKCGTNHPQTRAAETRFVVTGPQDGDGRFHALGECVTDETVSGDCRALTAAALRARAAMMESE